jgi:hypothetical protein
VLVGGADTDVTNLRKGDRMTLTAATASRRNSIYGARPVPTELNSGYGFAVSAPERARLRPAIPTRSFEVAALRSDGSLFIGQDRAPALPLFESAFSAFARGTLIQTSQGDVAVEDLQPGDMINTSTGEAEKLIWIGSSSFIPAEAGRRMPLIRIMADSFGQGRPNMFITVGPAARVLHTPHNMRGDAGNTGMLTPVRGFVDGVNVIEVVPPTPVRLFHICLSRHAAINVGGIEMETFHPGATAMRGLSQSLRDQFLGMFPQIGHASDFGPLAHPRAPEEEYSDMMIG